MRRRTALALATGAFVLAAAASTATAAQSREADLVSRINAERTARGLRALAARTDLADVARRWSARMAADGAISHDPDLPGEVAGWSVLGDNVGSGERVSWIHDAFMRSDDHRAIILDPAFNEVGVGIVSSDGLLWVTEVFVRRAPSARAPRAPSARASAPAARAEVVRVALTDPIGPFALGPPPVTVGMLERLAALDERAR